jgi:ribonuclease HI
MKMEEYRHLDDIVYNYWGSSTMEDASSRDEKETTLRIQRRLFEPLKYHKYHHKKPQDFTWYDKASGVTRLDFTDTSSNTTILGADSVDTNTIVVTTCVARPHDEGKQGMIFSMGIYFGPNSALSQYGITSGPNAHLYWPHRAELTAVARALTIIEQSAELGSFRASPGLKTVVIKTDSNFVVQSISKSILSGWELGFMCNRYEPPPSLQQKVISINDTINSLAARYHIEVRFWLVDKEDNKQAYDRAKQVLTNHIAKETQATQPLVSTPQASPSKDIEDESQASTPLILTPQASSTQISPLTTISELDKQFMKQFLAAQQASSTQSSPLKTNPKLRTGLMNRILDSKIEITVRDLLSMYTDADAEKRIVEQVMRIKTEISLADLWQLMGMGFKAGMSLGELRRVMGME